MIVTELHEGPPYGRSQNGSLYGTDRRARRGRRLREHSGLDIKGEKGSYAKAQPSAPVGWRRRIQRAIELSANNAEVRQELQDLLDENVGSTDQDEVAAVDESDACRTSALLAPPADRIATSRPVRNAPSRRCQERQRRQLVCGCPRRVHAAAQHAEATQRKNKTEEETLHYTRWKMWVGLSAQKKSQLCSDAQFGDPSNGPYWLCSLGDMKDFPPIGVRATNEALARERFLRLMGVTNTAHEVSAIPYVSNGKIIMASRSAR